MSCIQVIACKPAFNELKEHHSRYTPLPVNVVRLPKEAYRFTKFPNYSLRLRTSASRIQQCTPVCLFGGKGKSTNDNDASPWKSLEKAMSSLKKETSLEDVLRQQMEKKEYYDDGGSGGKRPGGGGGGGSGDGFGESDEGFAGILEEVFQVFMATLGIIFLYMFIISRDEVIAFMKDTLKLLFTRRGIERLCGMFYQFGKQYQSKYEDDPYALEKAILNTSTWWDSPAKYKLLVRALEKALSSDDEYDSS